MKALYSLLLLLILPLASARAQIPGCTDPLANNYNPAATLNDGSCAYAPATVAVARSWSLPAALEETSGLIIWEGLLWTHNDDTDIHLYAIDTNAIADYQAFELSGTTNTDWEEIAQDDAYVYVGDFGNNANGNRTDLHILRIEKSSLLARAPLIDTIWFSYALQTDFSPTGGNNTDFDCEALVVAADSIYLFTKEWVSQRSSLYALPKSPGAHLAQYRGAQEVQGLITGATYLEDKRLAVLCGYNLLLQPFLYLLYDFDGHDFFSGNKRKASLSLPFHQIEGIATADGRTYFVSNERFVQAFLEVEPKLHRLDLSALLGNYLDSPTGLKASPASLGLRAYPNPVRDELTLEAAAPGTRHCIELLNAAGQIVLRDCFAGRATFQVGSLPPGTYWLRVEHGQARIGVGKIIKQ
jgi:hypothetical protein